MVKHVSRDGVALAYDTAGAGEPEMVFVHGWSCDSSYFAPQLEYFGLGCSVLALDLRGHGDSDKPAPGAGTYTVEALADDVLAVIAAAGFARPVMVGHSLGALVGLACAVRSDAVGAVVMVDPAPITNEGVKTFFRESFDAVRADYDRSWRTAFVEGLFLPSDVIRRAEIIKAMPRVPPGIAAAAIRAIADFDGAGALGKVRVPVLSIGAAEPVNTTDDLRSRCPAITIGQTVGSGHFNQLEPEFRRCESGMVPGSWA